MIYIAISICMLNFVGKIEYFLNTHLFYNGYVKMHFNNSVIMTHKALV